MNKKGYTLIEIIVVIAIVATIGTFGAIGLSKILSNTKEDKYNEMINNLKNSASTYFTIYSEEAGYEYLKNGLYNNNSLIIPIATLKETLLVDQNEKNPKDNSDVYGRVVLTYNSTINYDVILCKFTSQQLQNKSLSEIANMEKTCN